MYVPGRILVADDETIFCQPLAELLRREGFHAEAVVDAEAAMARLRQDPFDLLISDIDMPGNAGLEFIQEVPKVVPGLPVILLTGHPTVRTAIDALQLAVVGYLVKPPDFDQLLTLARRAIEGFRARRQVQEQRQHLQSWLSELERLEVDLQKPPTAPGTATAQDFVANTAENLRIALFRFLRMSEMVAQAETGATARQHANRLHALQKTVSVLEATRRNFKSTELRDLRLELEQLLRVEAAPSSPPPET